ncbi:MAG: hypothetical protein BWZ03_00018 [bacterium ADurb.BinA186]|jgi:hypothetical protein|nr:MAG: hypothetical protein BWZ03_00018 [bacterium ADurb.BinA186]
MLLGNIKGKLLVWYYVLSSFFTAVFSALLFVLLGSFYVANDHSLLLNIFVWASVIFISYLLFYLIYRIVLFFPKLKGKNGPFLNGFAISAGFLGVLACCLALSKKVDDYTYVSALGLLTTVFSIVEIIFLIVRTASSRTKR